MQGIKGTTFKLHLKAEWFNKGDIISTADDIQLKILKVYKFTWWRKLLFWFGIHFHSMDLVKVKQIYSVFVVACSILLISGCASMDQSSPPVTRQDNYLEVPGNRYFNYTQSMQAKKKGHIK